MRWHMRQTGESKGAEVLVDGQAIAWLPVRSCAYTADEPGELPIVTFSLAAFDADISTYDPAKSRSTP